MNKVQFNQEVKGIVSGLKKYRPEKIILFGSAARGKFTEDSDLDFF